MFKAAGPSTWPSHPLNAKSEVQSGAPLEVIGKQAQVQSPASGLAVLFPTELTACCLGHRPMTPRSPVWPSLLLCTLGRWKACILDVDFYLA